MNISSVLIKNALVIDPNGPHHRQQVDVYLEEGVIKDIGKGLDKKAEHTVERSNLHISPGWFDLRANFRDPGHEHKEDLESGTAAAAKGGFTGVALSPETEPVIDSKADIDYLLRKTGQSPVNLFPMGAITKGLNGGEISEMYDMYQSGAVAFAHGERPFENTQVMKLALQYAREFAPPLHLVPFDAALTEGGQMHEGLVSTRLGLKGLPAVAEKLAASKIMQLALYAETKVHLAGVSSAEIMEVIHRDQFRNFLSCDVNLANLIFTDKDLEAYDTNLKNQIPIRSSHDREALLHAIRSGLITAVASNHQPQAIEDKRCEFDLAAFGTATLEIFFGALRQATLNTLPLDLLIELISKGPREILGLPQPRIATGEEAEITLFDPDQKWIFKSAFKESKAANYPFREKELQGKALGIINNGMMLITQ